MAALESNPDAVMERIDQRFDRLEKKLDRDFVWLTSVMVAGFVAIHAVLLVRSW